MGHSQHELKKNTRISFKTDETGHLSKCMIFCVCVCVCVLEARDRLKRSTGLFTVYRRIYQKRFIEGIRLICLIELLVRKGNKFYALLRLCKHKVM